MHSRLKVVTLESFLSKVAFESNLRKKPSRIEHVLIMKVSFERRQNCESFHDTRASFLSKVTFESDFRQKTFYCVTALNSSNCRFLHFSLHERCFTVLPTPFVDVAKLLTSFAALNRHCRWRGRNFIYKKKSSS